MGLHFDHSMLSNEIDVKARETFDISYNNRPKYLEHKDHFESFFFWEKIKFLN